MKTFSRLFYYINRHAKLFVLITSVLCYVSIAVATMPSFNDTPAISLDASWMMSLSSLLQHNQLMGRDSIFTYGPLSQVLAWLGGHLSRGNPSFDGYTTTVLTFQVVGIVLLCIVLWLIRFIDWRGSAFVILLYIPLNDANYRSLSLVICATLIGIAMSQPKLRNRLLAALGIGTLCFLSQLLTFDVGIYSIVVAFTVLTFYAMCSRWRRLLNKSDLLPAREYIAMLIIILLIYSLCNVAISIFFKMSSTNYKNLFDYQLYSIEIVRGYESFGVAWGLALAPTIVLIAITIFTSATILLGMRRLSTPESYILFSILIAALLQLKEAAIRSDLGHIDMGISIIVLLFLTIRVYRTDSSYNYRQVGWAFLLICLVATYPFASTYKLTALAQVVENEESIITHFKDNVYHKVLPEQVIPSELINAFDPTKKLLSFPYDNFIPIAMGREMVVPLTQAYPAFTEALQQKYIDVLDEQKNQLEIVYGIDGVGTGAIDNVMQVTRLPIIFDYIYRNFDAKSSVIPPVRYVLLQRRAKPRDDMKYDTLAYTENNLGDGTLVFVLSEPANCSLIRLTMRVTYPITSVLGRPNPLVLDVINENKIVDSKNMAVAEPGKSFQTYFQLIDYPNFSEVFGNAPVQQHAWDRLAIRVFSTGFLEVYPNSIQLSKMECVTFVRQPNNTHMSF